MELTKKELLECIDNHNRLDTFMNQVFQHLADGKAFSYVNRNGELVAVNEKLVYEGFDLHYYLDKTRSITVKASCWIESSWNGEQEFYDITLSLDELADGPNTYVGNVICRRVGENMKREKERAEKKRQEEKALEAKELTQLAQLKKKYEDYGPYGDN